MDSAARSWMEEISGTSSDESLQILLDIYTHGHQKYDNTPFFAINDPELQKFFNSKKLSYQILRKHLHSHELLLALIPPAFESASGGNKRELAALAPNLWVEERGSKLNILHSKESVSKTSGLSKHAYNAYLKLKQAEIFYTKPQVLAIPDSFNEGKWQELATLKEGEPLDALYTPLIGAPYLTTASNKLTYPTRLALKLEYWYTKINWVAILIILYAIALVLYKSKWMLLPALLLHTALLVCRILILQRPPVSNMAETILYVPWLAALAAFILRPTILRIAACTTVIALLTLLQTSSFGHQLEPVQAVLDSKFWLTIHVLMVVGSYPFFLLAGVIAHIGLIRQKNYSSQIRLCIYIGLLLLIPGTILGGVWAAESWGRFWDWDPKESWAFISSAFFLVVVHLDRFKKIGPFGFAIGAIIGFQAITFTWYGVNYILGTGLHSYGFGQGGETLYTTFVLGDLLFITAVTARKFLTRKSLI